MGRYLDNRTKDRGGKYRIVVMGALLGGCLLCHVYSAV